MFGQLYDGGGGQAADQPRHPVRVGGPRRLCTTDGATVQGTGDVRYTAVQLDVPVRTAAYVPRYVPRYADPALAHRRQTSTSFSTNNRTVNQK